SPAVSSSSSVMQSHSRLPSPQGTSSARWPMAKRGSVAMPTRPASSRISLRCSRASPAIVVHCWPSGGTYRPRSSPIGERAAALALGWAMHGARPGLGLLAAPLFALAWADVGGLAGDTAAAALTALSTVTVGRLLAGGVPLAWLKAGIVAMAIVDSILVFGNE